MVIDSSALLALFFNQTESLWVEDQMKKFSSSLCMSTVNLTEVLILLQDRQPQLFSQLHSEIISSSIRFVPPTVQQAERAAKARLKFPINLGDCFAYALAIEESCPILTLDRDFKKTDARILLPDA